MFQLLKYQIYLILSIIYITGTFSGLANEKILYTNTPSMGGYQVTTKQYVSQAGSVRVIFNFLEKPTKTLQAILAFDLNNGWKIYHKDSIDAGLPPEFTDMGSSNMTLSAFEFSEPVLFNSLGIKTLGYEKSVQLPFVITVADINAPFVFSQELFFIACNVICVPVSHHIQFAVDSVYDTGDITLLELFGFTINITPIAKFLKLDTKLDKVPLAKGQYPKGLPTENLTYVYPQPVAPEQPVRIFWILGVSVLAGFILNLMPCVFPILSLKVLSVVEANRKSMLYISMGICTVFIVLGGILTIANTSFGWGFQFQYGWFLVGVNIALVFMMLNLWDKFYIQIPNAVIRLIPSGTSENYKSFAHGVVATLLATPCSAPLVGTALGFAMGLGAFMSMLIFVSMGLGMALPYLILYIFPALTKKLPKPGQWMQRVKHMLSIPLFALILYIIYIQSQVIMYAVLGVIILIMLGIALYQWFKFRFYRLGIVCLSGLAIILGYVGSYTTAIGTPAYPWVLFEENKIAAFIADNKTVVVDVTAEWCITCQINKITTFERDSVRSVIEKESIVMMRADWTLPNDTILQYIHSWNRKGIPLTVVYTPEKPEGVLLPEILSPTTLLKMIQ